MGVTGLWTLIEPVGRPIRAESLAGERLAIDSSIWLYHFRMAMRDKSGRTLHNAHILGFLWRILRLLHLGIKPVFVFDGGAPVLKRRTLAARRHRREGAKESHARTAERLLHAQLREAAVVQALSEQEQQRAVQAAQSAQSADGHHPTNHEGSPGLGPDVVYQDDLTTRPAMQAVSPGQLASTAADTTPPQAAPSKGKGSVIPKDYHKDPYALPPMETSLATIGLRPTSRRDGGVKRKGMAKEGPPVKAKADFRYATEDELRDLMASLRPTDLSLDSPVFASLPVSLQYELVGDMRAQSRGTSFKRLQSMITAAPTASDFSRQQVLGLKTRNEWTQRVLEVTDEIGRAHIKVDVDSKDQFTTHHGRVVGSRSKEYVLVRNEAEGGFILGRQRQPEGDSKNHAIDVENPRQSTSAADALVSDDEYSYTLSKSRSRQIESDEEEFEEVQGSASAFPFSSFSPIEDAEAESLKQQERAANVIKQRALAHAKQARLEAGRPSIEDLIEDEDAQAAAAAAAEQVIEKKPATRKPLFRQPEPEIPSRMALASSVRHPLKPKKPAQSKSDADSDGEIGRIHTHSSPGQVRANFPSTEESEFSGDVSHEDGHAPNSDLADLDFSADMYAAAFGPPRGTPAKRKHTSSAERETPGEFEEVVGAPRAKRQTVEAVPSQFTTPPRPLRAVQAAPGTFQYSHRAHQLTPAPSIHQFPSLSKSSHTVEAASESPQQSQASPAACSIPAHVHSPDALNASCAADELAAEQPAIETSPQACERATTTVRPVVVPTITVISPEKPETSSAHGSASAHLPPQAVQHGQSVEGDDLDEEFEEIAHDVALDQNDDEDELSKQISSIASPLKSGHEETDTGQNRVSGDAPGTGMIDEPATTRSPSPAKDAQPLFLSSGESESESEVVIGADGFPLPSYEEMQQAEEEEEDIDEILETETRGLTSVLRSGTAPPPSTGARTHSNQPASLEEMAADAADEVAKLRAQHIATRRSEEDITTEMALDVQYMLRQFGIPYITGPMEAEAQCAALVDLDLCDGIITDDSDVFLFGGKRVLKNMFNDNKTVQVFTLNDLERSVGLDRNRLIELAYLLGSDYTPGLDGVGIVFAMEILSVFPHDDGLHRFRQWWLKVQKGGGPSVDEAVLPTEANEAEKTVLRKRLKRIKRTLVNRVHLSLAGDWPQPEVQEAYLQPQVDLSEEPFAWGVPDLEQVRRCLAHFLGWGPDKVDQYVQPVIQQVVARARNPVQQNLLNKYTGFNAPAFQPARRTANFGSGRLQQVVQGFRAARSAQQPSGTGDAESNTVDEAAGPLPLAPSDPDQGAVTASRARGRSRGRSRGQRGRGRGRSRVAETSPASGPGDSDSSIAPATGDDAQYIPRASTKAARGRARGRGAKRGRGGAPALSPRAGPSPDQEELGGTSLPPAKRPQPRPRPARGSQEGTSRLRIARDLSLDDLSPLSPNASGASSRASSRAGTDRGTPAPAA